MNYCELYKSRRERERDEILYFKYLYMARVSIFINKYLYWNSYKYCKKKKKKEVIFILVYFHLSRTIRSAHRNNEMNTQVL